MDREILFRGKRTDNGEWVEGDLLHGYCAEKSTDIASIDISCTVEVIPETVGQYTGLTDKNGKKIFEGDILKTPEFIGKVVYNNVIAAFIVEINDSTETCYHWSPLNEGDIERRPQLQYTEVIGNIHDNSELLEVKVTDINDRQLG